VRVKAFPTPEPALGSSKALEKKRREDRDSLVSATPAVRRRYVPMALRRRPS
jgi:hypothetical protein